MATAWPACCFCLAGRQTLALAWPVACCAQPVACELVSKSELCLGIFGSAPWKVCMNVLQIIRAMCERSLGKKREESLLERKSWRETLFQLNRSRLELQLQPAQPEAIDPPAIHSPATHQPSLLEPQFRTIMDTFPASAFHLHQLPELIRLLNSALLLQQCKAALGVGSLAAHFAETGVREQVLALGLVGKLAGLLAQSCPLLTFKALSTLRRLVSAVTGQLQFQRQFNRSTLPFPALLQLLSHEYPELRRECLLLLVNLLERNYQFETPAHKQQFLEGLRALVGSASDVSCLADPIFKLLQKINLNFENAEFNQLQIASQIHLKLLEPASFTEAYPWALARTTRALARPPLLKALNHALSRDCFSDFQARYPSFTNLLQLLVFREVLVENSVVTLFEQTPLSQLVSLRHIFAFFVHLRLLPKLRYSLLTERAEQHSPEWAVAISCLALVERLCLKKYSCFLNWLAKDAQFFMQLEQLYCVRHELLRKQLNSTLNAMIRATPHCLAYRLKEYSLIRLYFESLQDYATNTVKVGISAMRKSVTCLEKRPSQLQSQELLAAIGQEAEQVQLRLLCWEGGRGREGGGRQKRRQAISQYVGQLGGVWGGHRRLIN